MIGAKDARFWTAIFNTVRYVGVTVTFSVILGLALALALQNQSPLNMFLRVLFFLPSVTSGVAITVVWGHLFRGASYGLINSLRLNMGLPIIEFLADPNWTLPIVMMLTVWGGMGYNMILFLAGLQGIPQELYEAATVDGASTFDKFWNITLPMLRPTTVFIVVTSIIGSFQVFDAVYVLFAQSGGSVGGVLDSVLTIVSYLYELGFRNFQMGYASAIAWILFVIIFIFTMINLRIGRANEAF
jgi:multiple sugar transport system permease protein